MPRARLVDFPAVCRIFGCVAAERVSVRHSLLDAPNPLIRQSEHHDSGWGMAVYRFGLFDLFWVPRPGRLIVSSEKLSEGEEWHTVGQDVLLVLEPASRLAEPHAERLLGDELSSRAQLDPLNEGAERTGEERGRSAAERALRIAGALGR